MNALKSVGNFFRSIKLRLQENSFDSILGIVNFVPSLAGFSLKKEKVSVPFFIIHVSLLTYVYGVGSVVYQVRYAHSAGEFIKSYVNVSLFILIANNTYWFYMKKNHMELLTYIYGAGSVVYQVRYTHSAGEFIKSYVNVSLFVLIANHTYWFFMKKPLLTSTLSEMLESDVLARNNPESCLKHKKILAKIKLIIFIFYSMNVLNASFVYLPNRIDVDVNNYAMTPCYGIEPLTLSPYREVCMTLLLAQELSIMTVVLNYQALLIFVIGHTSLLYQILSDEMLALNNFDKRLYYNNPVVKEVLPTLIRRHVIILSIIDKFKALYSVPIGVNFFSNAVCISLFFYLPLPEWLQFMPILAYCFLVFFLYCFLCQRLTNAAELFEISVYGCGWENFEIKEKKAVYVMLRQAQKPVELLAADIIPVNISTFATTLQAMYKFFTVVKF